MEERSSAKFSSRPSHLIVEGDGNLSPREDNGEGISPPTEIRAPLSHNGQGRIDSATIISRYGTYQPPSEQEALKHYEKEHGYHKEFPLYSTRPWELKQFGQGIMLYFYFLRYMAWQFGMMACICGVPCMVIFLLGPWYNTGFNSLEVTTIGNYGLVSNGTLGAGNLTLLFGANPVTAADPGYQSLQSGSTFGDLQHGGQGTAPPAVQRELFTLQLFRADGNMTPSTIAGLNKRTTINAMALLDLVTCLFYFGFTLFFIIQTRRLALKADLGSCTIEDYSIRIENVPCDVTKEELQKHFEKFGTIHDIVRAREVWDIVYLARKKRLCYDRHEVAVATLQKAALESPSLPESLETEVLESEYDLAILKHAMKVKRMEWKLGKVNNIVEAYIVFENVESKEKALQYHAPKNRFKAFFKWIFRIGLVSKNNLRDGTWPIKVTEGPEPSDIIWENLQIKSSGRAFYGTLSFLLKALLLIAGFMATSIAPALKFSLGKWKGGPPVPECNSYCSYSSESGQPSLNTSMATFYSNCYNGLNSTPCGNQTICYECFCRLTLLSADYSQAFYCRPWASILAVFAGASALSVVAIVAVNYCLPYAMMYFSTLERHHTISATHKSTALALVVMFFLNTAVSIMVANAYLPYVRRALNGTAAGEYLLLGIYPDLTPGWFKTVGNSLLLAQWIGIFSRMFIIIYYYMERWYFLLPFNKKTYITQRQLNKAFNGPEFTLDEKYGMHTGVIFITLFLGGTMPLSYAISCISFVTIYWLEKHFLLKFCRRPVPYSDTLSRLITEILPWAAFYHLAFAAWSFSMIAVPESGMVTPTIKWILGDICWGLSPIWSNTNGLSGDQMTDRLAQANSFPLLLFLFILAIVLTLFSFVDGLSWFFGPLWLRLVRKVKQLFIIRHVNRVVNEHVIKNVANVANTVQQGVEKAVQVVGDTAAAAAEKARIQTPGTEKRERDAKREEREMRERQRDEDEAILDAAVDAAIRAQEEADEKKFLSLLDRTHRTGSVVIQRIVGSHSPRVGDDPEDVEKSAQSTRSVSKFKPTAQGLLEMPLFTDAIDPDTEGWKLHGPTSYRIQCSPLYEEIFDMSLDHLDHEENVKEIERLLQGRDLVVSRQRKSMRSRAVSIALKASTPREQLKKFSSQVGGLVSLSSVVKREDELNAAARRVDEDLVTSMKLVTLPDKVMSASHAIDMDSLPQASNVGEDFKRVNTPTGTPPPDERQQEVSRRRSRLALREGGLVDQGPGLGGAGSATFVETVLEEEEEEEEGETGLAVS